MQYKASSRPALRDLSFEVDKGEFAFLIGPSGSGKSTFFRLLLKEDRPTSGEVYLGEFHVNRLKARSVPKLRQSIGCVFQDFRLLQKKTVAENVAFALEVIGRPRSTIQRVVPEVLEYVGLEGKHDRMPNELSGGEMQRVAIARALLRNPRLIVADEPTASLDPRNADLIGTLLLELAAQAGATLVVVSHDARLTARLGRQVRLDQGRIAADGLARAA